MITKLKYMKTRSPGIKQHIEDGERKTSEDFAVTVIIQNHVMQ